MRLRTRVSHRVPRRRAAAALAAALALTLTAAPAGADPKTKLETPEPVWSGLYANDYAGPIGAHGTLITKTVLDESLTLPEAGHAYRVLYATEDIDGKPATSTGAIFLPRTPAPRGGYPVLAWAHGTVGLSDQCAPSVQKRSRYEDDYLDHWLRQGYAVVATDYAGLGTPGVMNYLSGQVQARSVIDSVLSAHDAGLPLAKKWAVVGQSQGAAAALNTAQRATKLTRGTGLDFRGVVATGAPANIEHIIWQAGPGFPSFSLPGGLTSYAAFILAGFNEARPDLQVTELLTPAGKRALRQAETLCNAEIKQVLRGEKMGDWFVRPVRSVPGAEAALVDYMATPYSGYDRPIFLGQGLVDVEVPAPSALSLYSQLRAHRQDVELHVYPDQGHTDTVLAAVPDSTPFLARILR